MVFLRYWLLLIIQFVFVSVAFPQLNVNFYIQEARADIATKKYYDAIEKLDVCLRVRPGESIAYFYRGVCKYFLTDNIGAEEDLNNAMSMYDPMLIDAYYYRSLVKYRLGDGEGAIKDIDHVIHEQADNPELYVERAFFELSDKDFNSVINDCNNALRMKYAGENVYLCRGIADYALAKYDSALLNFNIALKLNSKDIDVYVHLGMTDAAIANYNEAIVQYNKALKIDSSCTLAYFYKSEAELKLNKDADAMKDLDEVINYDPMNALAYFNRGILEANAMKYENAIADFDKVLLLNPKNIEALFNRANLNYETRNYRGALADYNTVIDLFPYYVEAYNNRARVKKMLHDNAGEESDYKLGKMMGELSHYGNPAQRAKDSTNLMHLLALNSNFSEVDRKTSDTTHVDFMPLFYIVLKDKYSDRTGNFPLVLKNSQLDCNNFYLTDKKDLITDTIKGGFINILNKTIKDTSGEFPAVLKKAVQETNMQFFNAAIKGFDKIIKQDTACGIAYFARGVALCREFELLGQFDQLSQGSFKSNTLHVNSDPVTDKYEKALSDFNKTIQLEPGFVFAYYDRAYVKYKLQDFNGAVDDYNTAIKLNPNLAEAYYNRGLLLFCQSDQFNACADFGKAGELGLKDAYTLLKLYCTQVTK